MAADATPSIARSENPVLFWGCFIALVTTAFGFIARMFLINTWAEEFHLDPAQSGALAGIGIWPFAVSIIGFSLLIDRIGYKVSMIIAFLGHIIWAFMGVSAYFIAKGGDTKTAYSMLYWGSLILALGNGTVEAFINPVVATMFSREKTKWLNILHAGWPGGLVVAGMVTIFIDHVPWFIKVGLIAVPAVMYFVMLITCEFPVQERVSSGVTYKDMLSEFGTLGALVVGFLITLQLIEFFSPPPPEELSWEAKAGFIGIGVAIVVAFGLYTRSAGRILMFVMILIMMPLATTEIGTDGWISGIMEPIANANDFHAGWILVYTSVIMMVLRFFAGPIVHLMKPLPLLAFSALLAIIGLYTLSFATGLMIFIAATLYGFGKTFFWPTMLGVVSEQTPKGGALTLNAISGIGMLAVGVLGFPYIGTLQADRSIQAVAGDQKITKAMPALVQDGKLTVLEKKKIYEIIPYSVIDGKKLHAQIDTLPEAERGPMKEHIKETIDKSKQGALANMVMFPVIMLLGYLALIVYFQMRGGYQQVHLDGGDHGPMEPAPKSKATPGDHPHGITASPPSRTGIQE